MPFFNLESGIRIHYLDLNPSGRRAVLLLHGLGVTGSSWQLQFPALEKAGFRVLAPDARGFGQSTYPAGIRRLVTSTYAGRGAGISEMAGDIAALIESRKAFPVNVVGISMGGTLALQLALDTPHLVDKLVLVNTFARLRPDRPGGWLYFAVRFAVAHTLGLRTQARIVAKHLFPRPEQEALRQVLFGQILQANPAGYRAALRALARFNVYSRLGDIRHPALVISGADDRTVPLSNQRQLSAGIPNARHVIIPQAGHAVIVEQPEAFNSQMIGFLAAED